MQQSRKRSEGHTEYPEGASLKKEKASRRQRWLCVKNIPKMEILLEVVPVGGRPSKTVGGYPKRGKEP